MPFVNHYIVLQLTDHATSEQIKARYRQLAKKYHPDINAASKERLQLMQQLNEAYDVLSNPSSRALYDSELRAYYSNLSPPNNNRHIAQTKSQRIGLRLSEMMKDELPKDHRDTKILMMFWWFILPIWAYKSVKIIIPIILEKNHLKQKK